MWSRFVWLKAVFLKLYEKHGKVHAIIRHRMRHLELSGTDNLRFDKKAISTFYFSTGYLFYFSTWKFGRTRNIVETLALYGFMFPLQFLVLPSFTRVSITAWKHEKCFLFLKCCPNVDYSLAIAIYQWYQALNLTCVDYHGTH